LLTHKNTHFKWNEQCEAAFTKLQTCLSESSCISYYDETKPIIVYCDASPVGISAILLQKSPDKEDPVAISYVSRSLSETEMRYSQIERECLAAVFACERNRLFLYGRSFSLINDNKALINILNNAKSKPPPRIERLLLRLQGYNFEAEYVSSQNNISDYFSRYPAIISTRKEINTIENHVNYMIHYAIPDALTIDDVKMATLADPTLSKLIELIRNEQWYKLDNLPDNNQETQHLKQFRKFRDTLSLNEEQNIILKDRRIIIPRCFERIVVKLAHIGHQGLEKTKALLRSKIFFLGMDKMVAEHLSYCIPCQAVHKKPKAPKVQSTDIPKRVWQTVHIDYLGPFPNGKYALAMIDERSRYPVVIFTDSTSAKHLKAVFRMTFSHFGYPEEVVSDNGPPFRSKEIKRYMLKHAIKHRHVTPYWPRANGEIERFMIPLTKIMATANLEGKDYLEEVENFLMAYRVTPHTTTKIPPSEIMFKRKIRHTIPTFNEEIDTDAHAKIDENDKQGKAKQRYYANKKCKNRVLNVGDKVLVLQKKQNKLSTKFNQHPYNVIAIKGTQVSAENPVNHHQITRNVSHFIKVPIDAQPPQPMKETFDEEEDESDSHGSDRGSPNTITPEEIENKTINHKQPKKIRNEKQNVTIQRKEYPKRIKRPPHEWRKY